MPIEELLDLERYPLDRIDSAEGRRLLASCVADLASDGMFNLVGLVRQPVLARIIAELRPVIDTAAFTHKRLHNIYFKKSIDGLPDDHPALRQVETVNHTICGDQMRGSIIRTIYQWPPLAEFLARAMGKPVLYTMADEIAAANVMSYRDGEALNWHFDRSEFTTTLLLQEPKIGGEFEYRTDLRSDNNPNYEGVAKLLEGNDPEAKLLKLSAGTLNVFRGKNTAHRVTTVRGDSDRIIAVFSYYERPGVMFTAEERIGFYGRAS